MFLLSPVLPERSLEIPEPPPDTRQREGTFLKKGEKIRTDSQGSVAGLFLRVQKENCRYSTVPARPAEAAGRRRKRTYVPFVWFFPNHLDKKVVSGTVLC